MIRLKRNGNRKMMHSTGYLITIGLAIACATAAPTTAADESTMMSICNTYAARHLHVSPSDIVTLKYEGQRTDGTHAVNGTVFIRRHDETFQCSFNSSGSQIVQFVVN